MFGFFSSEEDKKDNNTQVVADVADGALNIASNLITGKTSVKEAATDASAMVSDMSGVLDAAEIIDTAMSVADGIGSAIELADVAEVALEAVSSLG